LVDPQRWPMLVAQGSDSGRMVSQDYREMSDAQHRPSLTRHPRGMASLAGFCKTAGDRSREE